MKKTAVEWLVEKLDQNFDYVSDTIIEQAKAMEKEQIEEAFEGGYGCGYRDNGKLGTQYYSETFKSE